MDARTNQPLKTVTRLICDSTGTILDDLSMKTYHEYGPSKQRVYFTKNEMKQIKQFGDPSLIILGFKPINRLKHYHNLKPSYFMYPDETRIIGSTLCFNTLLQSCIQLKQMIICRFIYRKTSTPIFVALYPQKELFIDSHLEKPPGFHVIFLPYGDDIRKINLDGHKMRVIDEETNENDKNLYTKACEIIDTFTFKDLPEPCNPVLQKHYQNLEALALDEDTNNTTFEDEIQPNDDAMIDKAAELIEEFLNLIPEGMNVQKPKRVTGNKRKRSMDIDDNKPNKKAKKKNGNIDVRDIDWKTLADNDELKNLKVADLKIYLGNNKLRKTGKKQDLIERIKEHLYQ